MRADEILKKTASKRITPNQHKNKEKVKSPGPQKICKCHLTKHASHATSPSPQCAKMDETPRMYLYAGGINPNDILQGKVRLLWACLADHGGGGGRRDWTSLQSVKPTAPLRRACPPFLNSLGTAGSWLRWPHSQNIPTPSET